jgi:hypothetical protein
VSSQPQRHWPRADLEAAATTAGLRVAGVLGQRTGIVLASDLDESLHTKALFFAVSAEEGGERNEYVLQLRRCSTPGS